MQKLEEITKSQNAGHAYKFKKSVWTVMLGSKKSIHLGKRRYIVAVM